MHYESDSSFGTDSSMYDYEYTNPKPNSMRIKGSSLKMSSGMTVEVVPRTYKLSAKKKSKYLLS